MTPHLGGAHSQCAVVSRGHKDVAQEARQQLDAQPANPPSVSTLATLLGVGETTLRQAFKREIEVSVLDCLRHQRMQLARTLLRQHKVQIALIAYSAPANFSSAYRVYFGRFRGRSERSRLPWCLLR